VPIKGVALDLEGTVVNVENVHFDAFTQAARMLGFPCNFETIVAEIPNALGGGDRLIANGIHQLSDGKIQVEPLLCKKRELYNSILSMRQVEPRPGFPEVFEQIYNLGLPISIGSSTPFEQAATLLERSGLVRYFDSKLVVLANDVQNPKPAPDVFLETARRLGIDPKEQLVFEDSATGITAATAAGSLSVAMPVYWLPRTIAQLVEAGASRIFRNWREMNVGNLIENINAHA